MGMYFPTGMGLGSNVDIIVRVSSSGTTVTYSSIDEISLEDINPGIYAGYDPGDIWG